MKPDITTTTVTPDEGAFHVDDQVIDLSKTPFEGWIALFIFWVLAATVFYQFFTRYALNDSAAWTEEIARYLLIGTVFVGASIGVAKSNHIHVDLLYRFLPPAAGRVMSTAVDVFNFLFFAAMSVLTMQMMQKMGNYQMTIIDLPMNIVYGVCLFGFVMMTLRSAWVTVVHWRRGYSGLERPETSLEDH
jgi:TRAP-type transport system small permease protein